MNIIDRIIRVYRASTRHYISRPIIRRRVI